MNSNIGGAAKSSDVFISNDIEDDDDLILLADMVNFGDP